LITKPVLRAASRALCAAVIFAARTSGESMLEIEVSLMRLGPDVVAAGAGTVAVTGAGVIVFAVCALSAAAPAIVATTAIWASFMDSPPSDNCKTGRLRAAIPVSPG
jgi:hypothetical protein